MKEDPRFAKLKKDGGWKGTGTMDWDKPIRIQGYLPMGDRARVSNALGKWQEGCEHIRSGPDEGKVVIRNSHDEREICKRMSQDGYEAAPARDIDWGAPKTNYEKQAKKQADDIIGGNKPTPIRKP